MRVKTLYIFRRNTIFQDIFLSVFHRHTHLVILLQIKGCEDAQINTFMTTHLIGYKELKKINKKGRSTRRRAKHHNGALHQDNSQIFQNGQNVLMLLYKSDSLAAAS